MCSPHNSTHHAVRNSEHIMQLANTDAQYVRVYTLCMPVRLVVAIRIRKHCTIWHIQCGSTVLTVCVYVGACVVPFCCRCVRTTLRNVAHSTLEEHAANDIVYLYTGTESVALQPMFGITVRMSIPSFQRLMRTP